MKWDLDEVKKVDFTRLEKKVFDLIFEYGSQNGSLNLELILLIEMIKEERSHNDTIKSLAFDLANKI